MGKDKDEKMKVKKPDKSKGVTPKEELENAIEEGTVKEVGAKDDPSYHCVVCAKDLKRKDTIKNHLRTETHLRKLQESKPQETTQKLNSAKGNKKVQELKPKEAKGATSTKQNSASREVERKDYETDKLPTFSEKEARPNPEGVEEVEEAFKKKILLKNSDSTAPFWCVLCLKPLKVYGKLANHLSSIQHTKKVDMFSLAQTERGTADSLSRPIFEYCSDSAASRGHVYVFNVLNDRPGAKADSLNIKTTFESLGYDVFLHDNFTYRDIMEKITVIKHNKTLGKMNALILFILSHGRDIDTFIDSDNKAISLNYIKNHFTPKACPNLKGKPKIIFANYCRGKDIESDSLDPDGKLHASDGLVDTIVVHASNEGKVALRSKDTGTVFVKSLCKVLSREDSSRLFRHVFISLYVEMKQRRGTTPMAVDHVFREFRF